MPKRFEWLVEEGLLTGSVAAEAGADGPGGRLFLVVEALPDGGWDWMAWADDRSGRSLRGRCPTRAQAVQAAEHGVELLGSVRRGAGDGGSLCGNVAIPTYAGRG